MNTGAFGENFPYSNFHDLNMDWIVKIAKDFLDQYTHIQETIDSGLTALDEKATNLENLLQKWYDTHSEDIANQLADALQDLNAWYNEHQNYLDQTLTTKTAEFQALADQIASKTIQSIPADYSDLTNLVQKGIGIEESVTYPNWSALTNAIPEGNVFGTSKRYNPSILTGVKIASQIANSESHLYIVEVEGKTNNVLRYTDISFSNPVGNLYIPVGKAFYNDYYIFVKCKGLQWIGATSTYKAGTFTPGTTTTLTFPDDIQLAIGTVISKLSDEAVILHDAIYNNILERSYEKWDVLSSASSGVWGTNKKYDPGYIKSILVKNITAGNSYKVFILPVQRNNTGTEFKEYTFNSIVGLQEIPIEEYITYPFYVFTNAPVAYGENDGSGIYKSGTYAAIPEVSLFNSTYQFAIGVLRKPAIRVNSYWNSNPNIPVLGICPRNIVILGDSIMQGYGISDYNTCEKVEFPIDSKLSEYEYLDHRELISNNTFGRKLFNYIQSIYASGLVYDYGIGGLNTAQLLIGYNTYITDTTTDVIISIGTNDTSASDKRNAITNPLIKIINDLKSRGINVIVLTNTPQVNAGTAFNNVTQAIVDACNATGITPINVKNEFEYMCYIKGQDMSNYMYDKIHPNNTGYELLFQIVKRSLKI